MSTLSPSKKKLKKKKSSSSEDEDMPESSHYGDVVEITHTSSGYDYWQNLYKVGRDLKIKDISCNIHNEDMFIGDSVLEFNGVDMRGKDWYDLLREARKLKNNDKVTLKLLRVNGKKRYLHPGVEVILMIIIIRVNLLISVLFSAPKAINQAILLLEMWRDKLS